MFKMNALIPELIVADLRRSLRFYCDVVGSGWGFAALCRRPGREIRFTQNGGSGLAPRCDVTET
ncbi:MAG: hypothetical protein ACRERW_07085, partial [Pseudomonas sp.]